MKWVLTCFALIFLVVAAYGNSVSNGFVWDDHEQILLNPAVKPDSRLAPIFTTDARFTSRTQALQGKDYRPLQMLTYRWLFGVVGPTASSFHALSIAFAVACVLVVFGIFLRLTRQWNAALAAAAIFAVNPLHTEAVDWIASLADLGYALFLLLAFLGYQASNDSAAAPKASRTKRYLMGACSLLAFAAALLWKETAVILPLLIGTYSLLLEEQGLTADGWRRALRKTAPYLGVLAAYVAVRASVLGGLGMGLRDWKLSPIQFVFNTVYLMFSYWAKLLWPVDLNAYYAFSPIRSLTDPRGLISVFVLMIIVGILVLILRSHRTSSESGGSPSRALFFFGCSWVVIALLPAMNLSALGRNAFAERYLYLASIGFSLMLLLAARWGLRFVPSRFRATVGTAAVSIVLVWFTTETMTRNPDWKDDATLFTATLVQSPDAPFVRNMVAAIQSLKPEQSALAEENYRRSIADANAEVPPDRLDSVVAYRGLASVLSGRGQFDQALAILADASKVDPDDVETDAEKGMILAQKGDGRDAEPLLEHALAVIPNNENVQSALGLVARDTLHDAPRAVSFFEQALAAHPEQDGFAASQHNNLAAAYSDEGNLAAATEQLREAIRILPSDPEFYVNLAGIMAEQGDFAEARAQAQTAFQLAPNDPATRDLIEKLNEVPK